MMKSYRIFSILTALFLLTITTKAQNTSGVDSTGLPGDDFSLQGALQLFKQAGSPEEFEKLLNTESSNVNNLDLNGDGETDYVRVIDKQDGDVHVFILQVPVSEKESQDIAVIELEKTGGSTAMIQIIGDEDIYGEEVIVEPNGDEETGMSFQSNYGMDHGPSGYTESNGIIVNVWLWPSVRFIYGPVYRPWASPWRWRMHPVWWKPWHPLAWRVFHPRCVVYHRPFVVVRTHRIVRGPVIYRPVRMSSVSVRTRHSVAVNNYRVTRTKTTVTGPRGNSAIRTTTTVRGKHGKVKASKTTVRKRHR
ncbi:MAG TPA: hypothetical protein VHM26_15630 [Chitinophagaceae bacterium]|jgi:hypothetical protein|nr:hypothetical protein [Chitinophagaceae bacterium]